MMNAVERAAAAADTSPTPAQKEAGNYRKGHVKLHGLDISIENPAGSQRSGVGANGKPWSVSVPYHYGYIRRTMGADKDQVDVALNPLNPEVPKVHIVDQKNRDTGAFDEHKVFLGYHHIGEAKTAHENGFSDGFGHLRQMAVTETTIPWLKLWLHRGDTKKPFSQWMAKPRLKKSAIVLAENILLKDFDQAEIAQEDYNPLDHARSKGGSFSDFNTGFKRPKLSIDQKLRRQRFRRQANWDRQSFIALKAHGIAISENILLKARALNQRDVAEEHEEPVARGMASYLAWLGGKPAEMVGKTCNEYDHKLSADALPMDEMDSEMRKATRHLRYAFIRGGEVAHPINQKRLSKLSNIDVSFDDSAPQVSDALDDYQFGLIRSVNDGQRDTIKQVVSQGVMQGQPPAVIAARVRDAIGLTPSQAMQVLNFRNELQNLNKPDNLANAMSRTLRDQRFDRVITNAAVSGQDLPQDKVDQIVDAYKRRYIAYRAMTIARTESLRAANMGSMLAAQQMADQLGPDTVVTKKWIATMDNRTRETHRELHGQTVDGIDTPFVASDGAEIVYPHDPDAPAEETINCRCTLGFDYNQPDQSEPTDQTSDTREEA